MKCSQTNILFSRYSSPQYGGWRISRPHNTSRINDRWECQVCGFLVVLLSILNIISLFDRQMMRDERYYPEPDRFLPERFLDLEKTLPADLDRTPADPSKILFGFGRRYVSVDTSFAPSDLLVMQHMSRPFLCRWYHLAHDRECALGFRYPPYTRPSERDGSFIQNRVYIRFYQVSCSDSNCCLRSNLIHSSNSQPMPFTCRFIPRTERFEALVGAHRIWLLLVADISSASHQARSGAPRIFLILSVHITPWMNISLSLVCYRVWQITWDRRLLSTHETQAVQLLERVHT